MKILALECELPGAAEDRFRRLGQEEARAVWELHQAGVIRELYFRADRDEAVLGLGCATTPEAQRVVGRGPYVDGGVNPFDLIPLRAYPGFARLFEAGT